MAVAVAGSQPWPLQAFCPLQLFFAVLQALCPLHVLMPLHRTFLSVCPLCARTTLGAAAATSPATTAAMATPREFISCSPFFSTTRGCGPLSGSAGRRNMCLLRDSRGAVTMDRGPSHSYGPDPRAP